jgi:hypothetical protein
MIAPNTETLVIEARVHPPDIGYLNMLFESYEGVAVVRSVDPPAGLIQFWVTPSMLATLESAFPALAKEVGLVVLGRFPWTPERAG